MKKIVLLSGILSVLCFGSCPDLSKINPNKNEASSIATSSKTLSPDKYNIYADVISAANNTNKPEQYMSAESYKLFTNSKVFFYLVATYSMSSDDYKKEIVSHIDFKDINWCEKDIAK